MKTYTFRSLLATFLPLLISFLLYQGFVHLYLLQHDFWTKKDWGYLLLLIVTLARVGRLCIVAMAATDSSGNYHRLLRVRAIGYDALCGMLAPAVLLPVVGFVVVVQPEYLLMLAGYGGVAIGTCLFLELLWMERPVS